jgi:hypothetical protein
VWRRGRRRERGVLLGPDRPDRPRPTANRDRARAAAFFSFGQDLARDFPELFTRVDGPARVPGVDRPLTRDERDDARGERDGSGWGFVIRRLARDPDDVDRVLTWPVREALLAYLARARADTQREYDVARLMWAAAAAFGGGGDPPPRPPLLDD